MSQNLSAVKAKVENLEESDMKRQKYERENQDLIAELEKLTVIVDQYESLQDEARSANDQVNNLTNRLAQNASRYVNLNQAPQRQMMCDALDLLWPEKMINFCIHLSNFGNSIPI